MQRYSNVTWSFGPGQVRALDGFEARDYKQLERMGINFSVADSITKSDLSKYGLDSLQTSVTTPSMSAPVQFLQTFLPGIVKTITTARKIDELIGIDTVGQWRDEEVVQRVVEPSGLAAPYADISSIPIASWNPNFERRSVVRFEQGIMVGKLAEERSAAAGYNDQVEARAAAMLSLEVRRNRIGFFGFNNGNNRTYGFLNDPSLPAYVSVATGVGGLTWAVKTFKEITADIRSAFSSLRTRAGDNIDVKGVKTTLAIATNAIDYLSVTSDIGDSSVMDWLNKTYPKCRVVSAPELNTANGGAGVFYLYLDAVDDGSTDGGATWSQLVPNKVFMLGMEQRVKGFIEGYSNALGGVMLKRPWAVVRRTGIS